MCGAAEGPDHSSQIRKTNTERLAQPGEVELCPFADDTFFSGGNTTAATLRTIRKGELIQEGCRV